MRNAIKICGITTPDSFDCAARAGASHVGFVFFEKSPRNIAPAQAAALAARSGALASVALTVDATDDALTAILAAFRPALIQLHGHETPARVQEVRTRFAIPVLKAIPLAGPSDLGVARDHEDVADILLFDAAPKDLPGGNGVTFDWSLLAGTTWRKPWFLSGGLTPENVAGAIYQTRPGGVDVSSGVESTRGVKDNASIEAFVTSARQAFSAIAAP
ncbi:MAG: phosphoribosylanthranilate isomerase [Alphaproteobacteria bacterium]|nr:phosphoribosylanthranilate isomerase [Alphaproteobacteria bacterium]